MAGAGPRRPPSTSLRSTPRFALPRSRLPILHVPPSLPSASLLTQDPQARFAESFFKKLAARNAGGWNLIQVRRARSPFPTNASSQAEDYGEPCTTRAREDPWTTTHLQFPLVRAVGRTFFLAGTKVRLPSSKVSRAEALCAG